MSVLDALERDDLRYLNALEIVGVHIKGEPGSSMESVEQDILIKWD